MTLVGTIGLYAQIGDPCNTYALIEDVGDGDTGELRYRLPADTPCGTMCASVNLDALAMQDGFVNLSGSSTTRANAVIDMRIKDGSGTFEFTESGTSQNATANFPAYSPGNWVSICMAWDAPGVGVQPNVTVTIDGVDVAGTFASEGADITAIENGVRNIQFRFAGNSATDAAGVGMCVDEVSVTNCAGETIWTEDFAMNAAGDVLTDPPFHANSAFASVAVEDAEACSAGGPPDDCAATIENLSIEGTTICAGTDFSVLMDLSASVMATGTTHIEYVILQEDPANPNVLQWPILGVTEWSYDGVDGMGGYDFSNAPPGNYVMLPFAFNQGELDAVTFNPVAGGVIGALGGESLHELVLLFPNITAVPIPDPLTVEAVVGVVTSATIGAIIGFDPCISVNPEATIPYSIVPAEECAPGCEAAISGSVAPYNVCAPAQDADIMSALSFTSTGADNLEYFVLQPDPANPNILQWPILGVTEWQGAGAAAGGGFDFASAPLGTYALLPIAFSQSELDAVTNNPVAGGVIGAVGFESLAELVLLFPNITAVPIPDPLTVEAVVGVVTSSTIAAIIGFDPCIAVNPGSFLELNINACGDEDCLGVPGGTALPGSPCDDGNPETENDVYQADCSCAGQVVQAADCLGVPGGTALPGTPCDDGDPNTTGDVYLADCSCAGAPSLDCLGVPGGTALPGTPCDDGNPDTENDVYGQDCSCAGTDTGGGGPCISISVPFAEQYACTGGEICVEATITDQGPNDVMAYIVHTSPAPTPETIVGQGTDCTFSLADIAGGTTNTVYYVSAVASTDDNGNGLPDFGESCFTIASGASAVFLEPIEIIDTDVFCDEGTLITTINYLITGGLPGFDSSQSYSLSGDINGSASTGVINSVDYVDGQNYSLAATDGVGCSDFVSGGPIECVKLPVEFLSFNGEPTEQGILIDWATATELDSDFFILERSRDGQTFETIATIAAAGESVEDIAYNFLDTNISCGQEYYYRLSQVDFNGQLNVHNELVRVETDDCGVSITSISPIPADTEVNIRVTTEVETVVSIQLFDINGKNILTTKLDTSESDGNLKLDVSDLSAGIYLISVGSDTFAQTSRLIVK